MREAALSGFPFVVQVREFALLVKRQGPVL